MNKEQNELYKKAGLRSRVGYANGYVAVPPEHPLFGSDYDYPEIHIHGGLAYSKSSGEVFEIFDMSAFEMLDGDIPEGYWVFGFDTFHLGDNPVTRSREWCIEETNRLKEILENWNI